MGTSDVLINREICTRAKKGNESYLPPSGEELLQDNISRAVTPSCGRLLDPNQIIRGEKKKKTHENDRRVFVANENNRWRRV